jgi:DNA/RNA-binding domain of Phe-tRNA-synthetase-like protein
VYFRYHPDIFKHYPELKAGVVLARNLDNKKTPDDLLHEYIKEQNDTLTKLENTQLSELPSLSAWRAAFRKFGINPTKYRSAPESLLRRLTKKGDIPSINMLVDINNLISIRYFLPVATFDVRDIKGGLTVKLANGDEHFTPLGMADVENPQKGEVVFVDENDLVVARRWCWRQSQESAAQLDTNHAILTIEGHHEMALQDIRLALRDLLYLLEEYSGGDFVYRELGLDSSEFRL